MEDTIAATVIQYKAIASSATKSGFLENADEVMAPDRGNNLFVGIVEGTISQDIDVSNLSSFIDDGAVKYGLSAWIGGWQDHSDNADIEIDFLDDKEKRISYAKIGPVTVQDRNVATCMYLKEKSSTVPVGTRSIKVKINSHYGTGLADAYVDNIKLILSRQ